MKGRAIFMVGAAVVIALGVVGLAGLCQPSSVLDQASPLDVGSWWPALYATLAGRTSATSALTVTGLFLGATLTMNHALSKLAFERRAEDADDTSDQDFYSASFWRDNSSHIAMGFGTAAVLSAMSAWLDPNPRSVSVTALLAAGVAGFAVWLAATVAVGNASAADRALREDERVLQLLHIDARLKRLPAESLSDTSARQHWHSTGWVWRALRVGRGELLITLAATGTAALVGWGTYCVCGGRVYSLGVLMSLFLVALTVCLPTVYIAICATHFRWMNYDSEEKGDKWSATAGRLRTAYVVGSVLVGLAAVDTRDLSAEGAIAGGIFLGLAVLLGPAAVWWLTSSTAAGDGPSFLRHVMHPFWVTVARSLNRRRQVLVCESHQDRRAARVGAPRSA
ncbi:hypothetical protein AXK59_23665 [Tsukamurella tyrosinosolvens]|nr:hypothetical protein AXK59_23665 [Tsukamurella tyrosinosolvens]